MKSNLKFLSILFLCITALSCSEDDAQDDTSNPSTVYNEESFVEINTLNGTNIGTTAFTDGVTSGTNTLDVSDFGTSNLTGFSTGMGTPIDDTVNLTAGLDSANIVLTNGTEVPPFFAGGNVGEVFDAFDGVLRQQFYFNFTYPSNANPIPINTIDRIRLVYKIDYTSSGDLIHTKTFTHTIFFN